MNNNEKKPTVSTAIPKTKAPPMKRVSPGVYRDAGGGLVRSKDGQRGQGAQPRHMPGNVADIAGRLAGELGAQPNGKPTPGGIADSVKQPGLADIIARGAKPLPNRGGGSLESNLQRLIDMFNKGNSPMGRPVPKMPMDNIDPGFAAESDLITPEIRASLDAALAGGTPQIPRSGGSITDMLRRR